MQKNLGLNIKYNIKLKKKYIVVYLKESIFIKQPYINMDINYTFFLIILILSRYGLFYNINNK